MKGYRITLGIFLVAILLISIGGVYPPDYVQSTQGSSNVSHFSTSTVIESNNLCELSTNDYGLQWGVESGQSLVCELTSESLIDNSSVQLEEYVCFAIGILEEVTVDLQTIPSAPFNISWYTNETLFDIVRFFSWYSNNIAYFAPPSPAIMKGNWTLFTELIEELNEDPDFLYSVFETATTWGYNLSIASDGFSAKSHNIWFKSNGTLKLKMLDVLFSTDEFIHSSLTQTSLEPLSPTSTITDTLLSPDLLFLVAVGTGVLLVVIIVFRVFMKRK